MATECRIHLLFGKITSLEAGHYRVLITNECSSFISFRRVVV